MMKTGFLATGQLCNKIKRIMKSYMVILPLSTMTLCVSLPKGATAQIAVLEVIQAGVKKVIKAVDLKVQRLQNETIWLQNAQKVLENQLSKLKLTEIADWSEKQKDLYAEYYSSLWKVKSVIAYYKRVQEITSTQVAILDEYRWAWALFEKDKHFSARELLTMQKVYSGILDESIKNLDELLMVVSSLKTQMEDSARLEIIAAVSERMQSNYADLKRYNTENASLSLKRASSLEDAAKIKEIYGL
jgi:hypothetical protein